MGKIFILLSGNKVRKLSLGQLPFYTIVHISTTLFLRVWWIFSAHKRKCIFYYKYLIRFKKQQQQPSHHVFHTSLWSKGYTYIPKSAIWSVSYIYFSNSLSNYPVILMLALQNQNICPKSHDVLEETSFPWRESNSRKHNMSTLSFIYYVLK